MMIDALFDGLADVVFHARKNCKRDIEYCGCHFRLYIDPTMASDEIKVGDKIGDAWPVTVAPAPRPQPNQSGE